MILQALCNFYENSSHSSLPRFGFESTRIPFIAVIDDEGRFAGFEDTRTVVGKRKIAKQFLVPKAVKKTSGIAANLLWDVSEYSLGIDYQQNTKRTREKFSAFCDRLERFSEDHGVQAVLRFLSGINHREMECAHGWAEIIDENPVISFKLKGEDRLVCQRQSFLKLYEESLHVSTADSNTCLISGISSQAALLHPSIKGLSGAQATGANIVSFNLPAFTSWGKKQGRNAPVSTTMAFEYTSALNYLLAEECSQNFRIGSCTFVYWVHGELAWEQSLKWLFIENISANEINNSDVSLSVICSASKQGNEGKLFVLGLSPNNARISVNLWSELTEPELRANLKVWFQDLEVIGIEQFGRLSLETLLKSCCRKFKLKMLPERLVSETLSAVLQNQKLPLTLMEIVLSRIRSEGTVSYIRAALIKVLLIRKYRYEGQLSMEITPELDDENTQPGYVLGRLFSVFERLQEEAHKSRLTSSVTSRFYGGASTRPQSVFNSLFLLHVHHLRRLSNPGREINFRKMIGDLMQTIDCIPVYLNHEQQCLFAIGYYHQRQSFYQSKADNEEDSENDHEFE